MRPTTTALLLACLLACLLAGCQAPEAAAVAAERGKWTRVRDYEAGQRNAEANAAFADFMIAWDSELRTTEEIVGQQNPKGQWNALLRAYGLAIVNIVAAPIIKEKAPAAFRLLDVNADGMLSEQELLSFDPSLPANAAVVVLTIVELIRKHR